MGEIWIGALFVLAADVLLVAFVGGVVLVAAWEMGSAGRRAERAFPEAVSALDFDAAEEEIGRALSSSRRTHIRFAVTPYGDTGIAPH